MATFQEVITRALNTGKMKLVSVNQNLVEVARETKKKSAFVKLGVPEELAVGLMHRQKSAFIVHMDGDELSELAKQIDAENEPHHLAKRQPKQV